MIKLRDMPLATMRSVALLLLFLPIALAGSCPSGANYPNSSGSLVTLSSLGITNCYYVAANGSDSNTGADEAHPWLHAPGMTNCTNNCSSHSLAAGDAFIFRGGDSWHFGATTSPSTGGMWDWANNGISGTSSHPIYIGVDQTWYSGGAWTRPIFTGDNPPSTSPVASCAYQIGPSKNNMLDFSNTSYVIFDNFELTGLCQNSVDGPFAHDTYLVEGSSNNTYERLYIHGWTAVPFSCTNGVGHCFNMFAILGSNLTGDLNYQIVVDGTDSVPNQLGVMFGGGYNISQCVFRYVTQIVTTRGHLVHDNLFEHWYQPGDNAAHGNLYEESGSDGSTPVHAYYNNVFRHICSDSNSCPSGIVGIWLQPDVGQTAYVFNNVSFDSYTSGNYFDIGQNGGDQGTINLFNNVFENPGNGPMLQCSSANAHPFTATNNLYITDSSSAYSSPCSGSTFATELKLSHAAATAAGYTAAQTYGYSPTAAGNPTVGTGTNRSAYCSALSTAAVSDPTLADAASACLSDTKYACTYNVSDHTVRCPARTVIARPASSAWDIGAYQYGPTGESFSGVSTAGSTATAGPVTRK